MNGFQKTIRNFFGTTRAQTNGFVGLLFIIAIAMFTPPLMRWYVSTRTQDFSADIKTLDSLTAHWETNKSDKAAEQIAPERQIVYFPFDPNKASQNELESLGFSQKLASRIINYRNKNGRFKIKSDLLRMYGMDSALYISVFPHIELPETYQKPEYEKKTFANREKPEREKAQKFNLNEADTAQLEKIYGIGSKLALRIVKYRDKLGGFVSSDQLKEVYGLDTAVIEKILKASYLPDQPFVKKINLNTADEKILAAHPYFGRRIASAIVAYRFQHGNFKSVDDLSRITVIDKNNLGKLFPYATVDP